jgi:hypothetical protein
MIFKKKRMHIFQNIKNRLDLEKSVYEIIRGTNETNNNNDDSEKVSCELCNKLFNDCNEFIIHCEKDFNHKALVD